MVMVKYFSQFIIFSVVARFKVADLSLYCSYFPLLQVDKEGSGTCTCSHVPELTYLSFHHFYSELFFCQLDVSLGSIS